MIKLLWKSKTRDKVIEDPVCSSNGGFVLRFVCSSIVSKVIYHNQNVLVAPELHSRRTKSMESI